jgi:hypothetical protein
VNRATFTPPCGLDIAATTIADAGMMARIAEWGYRLIIHDDGTHFVHEAYYDAAGALLGFALAPARPCAANPAELRAELDMMAEALDEEPIRYADFAEEAYRASHRYGRYEGFPDVTDHPGHPEPGGDGHAG